MRATHCGQCPISTHALREEGDLCCFTYSLFRNHFYPRPPRGGRQDAYSFCPRCGAFLPTPSARRATLWMLSWGFGWFHFYPRPPRGGRHRQEIHNQNTGGISTHALREEGDCENNKLFNWYRKFLPTPSARRATIASSPSKRICLAFLPTPSARRATGFAI